MDFEKMTLMQIGEYIVKKYPAPPMGPQSYRSGLIRSEALLGYEGSNTAHLAEDLADSLILFRSWLMIESMKLANAYDVLAEHPEIMAEIDERWEFKKKEKIVREIAEKEWAKDEQ